MDEEEMKKLPEGIERLKQFQKLLKVLQFRIQVSPLDCTGCGNCVDVCPAKTKALVMKELESSQEHEMKNWEIISKTVSTKIPLFLKTNQLKQPVCPAIV
jgi:pyruvate-ferredoxin/flavodoxin oxidoreductase